MGPSDEMLLRDCRRGDEEAWEALVRRYQRLIISIPRRAGLDEDGSAEVFQNVFASLIERLDHIEHPERIQSWLVTAAKRETWRAIRQKRERQFKAVAEEDEDELDQLPDNAPLPDEEVLRLERQHLVRSSVALLDDRCRKLIGMLFYSPDPPPYSEVASALGLPEGSIGPTRARCLQKMLRILERLGG